MNAYKLVESNKYLIGDDHYKWYLYTGLYQNYQDYYYIIFDKEEPEKVIISCIVSPKTINELNDAICEGLRDANKLENIDDFYHALQNSFYANMFRWNETITA